MKVYKTISILYVILTIFCLLLIGYIANYLYASQIDGHHNAFFINGWDDLKVNYLISTGRWAQGLTNDYRFHTNRLLVTIINNLLFVFSLFYFVKQFFQKKAVIITAVIYFTFLYNAFNLYQITHLLNTSLSYTFGMSLIFLFFGIYYKNKNLNKYSNRNIAKVALILQFVMIIFVTGLVEHLFILLIAFLAYFVFDDFVDSIKQKRFKFNLKNISYLFVATAGALIVIFSPGNTKRREITSKRLEGTEYGGVFDFEGYFDALYQIFTQLLNLNSLLFFIFIFVIFSMLKKNRIFQKEHTKKLKLFFILLFSLLLVLTPITLGFIASNGKVGMPKAYNLTGLLFLFFLSVIAYVTHAVFKIKLHPVVEKLALLFPLLFFLSAYFTPGNNLFFQQDQVFSGNLKSLNEEVFARRSYLLETNTIYSEKYIPEFSAKYKGKVYAGHRYLKMNRYYNSAFNNGISVLIDKSLPSSLEFYSIFLSKNNKIKPIYAQGDIKFFYNKKQHTLVLEKNKGVFNTNKYVIEITKTNKTKAQIILDIRKIKKSNKAFYAENPNHIPLILPRETENIKIKQFNDFLFKVNDAKNEKLINYDFNYNNVMR